MLLKKYFSKIFRKSKSKNLNKREIFLSQQLYSILGIRIKNVTLYNEAFSVKSNTKKKVINFERLEFLGDSVLGTIISSYLFTVYPDSDEGFLTQMKSKIVNRKNLNKLGEDLGLTRLLYQAKNGNSLGENISGNLFEAMVGALFIDFNYDVCEKIVLTKLLTPFQISRLENKIVSYKSLLLEWSQKKKVVLLYSTIEERRVDKSIFFKCEISMDNNLLCSASEISKKKAEEKASQRAFYALNKKENILGNI